MTISTPFAGSWTADWASFCSFLSAFRDVGRRSGPINEAKSILNVPWTQIVSTSEVFPIMEAQMMVFVQ